MFTGIVQGIAVIDLITDRDNIRTYRLAFPAELTTHLALGASVSNNGCCLTVVKIEGDLVTFDIVAETLSKTTLGQLREGDSVNIERSMTWGGEIGGHIMSGHVYCTAMISAIKQADNGYQLCFTVPEKAMSYILHKGFVGVDGMSLTVGEVTATTFMVHLIPETLQRTTIGYKKVGDWVNIELDPQTQAIVDTVERVLAKRT